MYIYRLKCFVHRKLIELPDYLVGYLMIILLLTPTGIKIKCTEVYILLIVYYLSIIYS